jgi:hypothetical protein
MIKDWNSVNMKEKLTKKYTSYHFRHWFCCIRHYTQSSHFLSSVYLNPLSFILAGSLIPVLYRTLQLYVTDTRPEYDTKKHQSCAEWTV